MKILHIINTLNTGGAERLLTNILPIMKEQGNEVHLLLLNKTSCDYEKIIYNYGISINSMELPLGRFDFRAIFRLKKYMQVYDVIHVHLFPSQYWAAIAHKVFRSKSVLVTTEHSTFNTRGKFIITSLIDRFIYGLYDGIICISEGTKDFMSKRTPKHVHLIVIENGIVIPKSDIPLDTFAYKEYICGKQKDNFMLLQVARFSEQKNQDCLIRALKLLPENIHAVFAGDGKRLDLCKKLSSDLGLSHRTHFIGNRNDIDKLWQITDIGVMSSHWEGFGLAAVEGMAYAKPVLGSNVPGLAEVIGNQQLLFTPNDEYELAKKITALKENHILYKKMADYCKIKSHEFDITNTVNRYIEFYHKLLTLKNI